jgi:NAD-dependent dihydropyrimidine dehydrogenase PreA subunit
MQSLRYLEDAVTLELDAEKCNGCRTCTLVCPHGVFAMVDKRAVMVDRGACMECGACALNCSTGAISVTPGVGCAAAIINGWLTGTEPSCGCSGAPTAAASPAASGGCCGGESAPVATSCCGESAAPTAATGSCCGDTAAPPRGGSCC